ncbi:response regulator transcription factor [Nocardioides cynanchi]|uniref:response regulator transcription factor n=1 Tax=Nocardioides cynanchi TaxID=2558918 RepID=UPI00192DB35D|nr:helix-turn-helix transcriptional regulator [Nocardioides cynanchi]
MRTLLDALSRRHGSWAYPRRLLSGYDVTTAAATSTALVEQLSARELDVLRLLAGDLTGPEIARELVVSLNTVRTHTKNIYAKLGVTSRRAAVSRGGELHLIGRGKITT